MKYHDMLKKYRGEWVLFRVTGKAKGEETADVHIVSHATDFKDIENIQKSSKEHLASVFVVEK